MKTSSSARCVLGILAAAALTGCGGPATLSTPIAGQQSQSRTINANRQSLCPCIYVANEGGGNILVFPASAKGKAAPIQNIGGAKTGLEAGALYDVAVDSSGNIYATSTAGGASGNGAVLVFAAGSTGNVTPMATISGSNTGLSDPDGIALDQLNGDIYVANATCVGSCTIGRSITIYAPGSNGNTSPIGIIAGSYTSLDDPGGLALDAVGNIYVPNGLGCGSANQIGCVTIYPTGSTGNVAPSQMLSGETNMNEPAQVALNANANMLYVANSGFSPNKVVEYTEDKYGVFSPSASISGKKTKLNIPAGIALDSTDNIYVANTHGSTITVYAAGANGDPKPIRTIKGKKTRLDYPRGIAIR